MKSILIRGGRLRACGRTFVSRLIAYITSPVVEEMKKKGAPLLSLVQFCCAFPFFARFSDGTSAGDSASADHRRISRAIRQEQGLLLLRGRSRRFSGGRRAKCAEGDV